MEADLVAFASGIQFDGYNPIKTRKDFVSSGLTMVDLKMLMIIYANIGNNSGRLQARVVDVGQAKRAMETLKKCKIGSRPSDPLTLPKLASAFAPVYLAIRVEMKQKGLIRPPQIETSTPVEFCDVCFNGLYDQADDFCMKMGRILTKASKPKLTDDECDSITKSFRGLARAGKQNDEKFWSDTKDLKYADLAKLFG